MELKNVAVICSEKVSDGLMMMVASHRLLIQGSNVITFHNRLDELSLWFQFHSFACKPAFENLEKELSSFDFIILQYDASPYAKEIIRLFSHKARPILSIFYPIYSKYTHPPLTPWDRVFNKHLPMVENIALAISSLLQLRDHSKNNGLLPPPHLLHRKYNKRVAILPSKTVPKKYDAIAREVAKLGFDPLFVEPSDLCLGASLIFESGYFIGPESDLCHLASNLQIPSLVVSGNKKPLCLWRPGWLRSCFLTPPPFIPKIIEQFIFTPRVTSAFKNLVSKDNVNLF